MLKFFSLVLFFAMPQASALVIDLSKEISAVPEVNIYDSLKDAEVRKLSPVSKLKYYESRKQWDDCLKKSGEVYNTNKIIGSWIMQTWLNCAMKKFETQKKSSILQSPIDVIKKNISMLDRGPWKSSLTSMWIKTHQLLWDLTLEEKKANLREKSQKKLRDSLFLRPELLTQEQRFYFVGWPLDWLTPFSLLVAASLSLAKSTYSVVRLTSMPDRRAASALPPTA